MAASDELQRAKAFMAAMDEMGASRVDDWSHGAALVSPEIPRVWDASYFRIDDAPAASEAGAIADEAVATASRAGLSHAALVVPDEAVAEALATALAGLGFETTRLVVMALRRTPPAPEVEVEEVPTRAVAASRREISLEFSPGDEELADQLEELERRLQRMQGRWFAVREGGEVIARAWLLGAGDGVGQVEDVATAPAARGRGLARAVVSAAARASLERGDDLTFVVADADETASELYAKVGFEPVGHRHRFVKRLDS